jgi:hypothetical protein
LFVDNIRFLSMAAVVALHSTGKFGPPAGVTFNPIPLAQTFKFGTIPFFLISGFLLGDGVNRRSPVEYMRRRVKTLFAPWLLWFSLRCGLYFVNACVNSWPVSHSPHTLLVIAANGLSVTFFLTVYWFVPNLLLSIGILLLCRRFLFDFRLGAVLFVCSSFYGLNLYYHWLAIQAHTEAFLGFVFYLWLGAWAAKNFPRVEAAINRIRSLWVIAIVILTWVVGVTESFLLLESGSQDSRFTNQLYSVAVVILMFKVHRTVAPLKLSVRTTTFGIYLIHDIAQAFVFKVARRTGVFHLDGIRDGSSVALMAIVLTAGFVMTYSLSLLATKILLTQPRLSWTVGFGALSTSTRTRNVGVPVTEVRGSLA